MGKLFIKQNRVMVYNGDTKFHSKNSVKIKKEYIMTPDDAYHPICNLYLSDEYAGIELDDTVEAKDFMGVLVKSFEIDNDFAILFF